MGVFNVLSTAGSALTAQRLRMDVTASNIANAESTNTPRGGPYKRARVVFQPMRATPDSSSVTPRAESVASAFRGVQVQRIIEDQAPPRLVQDPTHPDADADGNVAFPNVDLVTEMTDMLSASRAYEANLTVINVSKNMAQRAIDLGRA
ncbi:MAG: flagellar basal body rod protein FlgC [Chloroflexota bacterium]